MTLIQLTPNFHEREFHRPLVSQDPSATIRTTWLPRVAALCQWLRGLAGTPGRVTSYYRAGDRGQHGEGKAADVTFYLTSPRELAERAMAELDAGRAPNFGQLIFYPDTGHVHISTRGATKYLSIELASIPDSAGKRTYSPLVPTRVARLPAVHPRATQAGAVLILLASLAFFFPVPLAA